MTHDEGLGTVETSEEDPNVSSENEKGPRICINDVYCNVNKNNFTHFRVKIHYYILFLYLSDGPSGQSVSRVYIETFSGGMWGRQRRCYRGRGSRDRT